MSRVHNQNRAAHVGVRAATPCGDAGQCVWCGPLTPRPTQVAMGKGLSRSMCRKHVDHLSRHGHPTKASYPGTWLAPLERLARVVADEPHARLAALASRNIILSGEQAGQIYPTDPKLKAKAVLGRLYAKYCGERSLGERTRWPQLRTLDALAMDLVCIALSTRIAHTLDPPPGPLDLRFAHTQVGKVIYRRAGGWLRRFSREDHSQREHLLRKDGCLVAGPAIYEVQLNRYGVSRGPALAYLGAPFWAATEDTWEAYGTLLVDLARQLPSGPSKQAKRTRGGKRAMATAAQPFRRPHDKERKLTRKI